ncbi:MAG: helix-turn-helix transcriptional regulator [Thermoleophilia bacterium]|nr:helix-turn-helix transcriptional regulator [Thermoleophilia bacterium]
MAGAVGRHGYGAVHSRRLAELAGVSKTTLYGHFEGVEGCFVALLDELFERAAERVAEASEWGAGPGGRMQAGLESLASIVEANPAGAHLVLVDSLGLGSAGTGWRDRAERRLEKLVSEIFRSEGVPISGLSARVIVGGAWHCGFRALRDGRPEDVRRQVPVLAAWALSHCNGGTEQEVAISLRTAEPSEELGWQKPPSSAAARIDLTQRERIVRAVAQLVAEQGHGELSIPKISARAGTSNATYYENFRSKDEALEIALDALTERALRTFVAAFEAQRNWASGVAGAVGSLCHHIATEPIFAQLAFFELPASGQMGLARFEAMLDAFVAALEPKAAGARSPQGPGRVLGDAIAGGTWEAIRHELAQDRRESLPELAPRLAAAALAPFETDG